MVDVLPTVAAALPDYEISQELGRGGMGVVYLGRHRHLGRAVAVKELVGQLADDPEVRSRFLVEAKAMASLDHPHVVPVYDYVERGGRCILVMEALPGGTVWERFRRDGLAAPEAVALAMAVCSALEQAHRHGILHRDIKPENVLFSATGDLKVTDFGIAKVINGSRTLATVEGSVLGTPAYMAPEQAEGAEVGPAVDVYATATMLFELLSGRLPFEGGTPMALLVQRISDDPPSLAEVAPHVPAPVAAAVDRSLARVVAERTPTAEAFGCDLAAAAAEAWGPGWLAASGVVVMGSPAITGAATTIGPARPTPAAAPGEGDPSTGGAASATIAPRSRAADETRAPLGHAPGDSDDDDVGPAPVTVAPAAGPAPATVAPIDRAVPPSADPPAVADAEAQAQAESEGEGDGDGPADRRDGAPAADDQTGGAQAPGDQPAPAPVVVRPEAESHVPGFVAGAIDRAELVDIAGLTRRPPRAWPAALLAAVAAVAAALLLLGGGPQQGDGEAPSLIVAGSASDGEQPIEVDLGEPVRVEGVFGTEATLELQVLGVPVVTETAGVGPDGTATFDLGPRGHLVGGRVAGQVEVAGGPTPVLVPIDVRTASPWFLSGLGIAVVVVGLAAAASAEAHLRMLRRHRSRVRGHVGLAASVLVLGAALCLLASLLGRPPLAPERVAQVAALLALAAVAAASARTRRAVGRRVRARQAIRRPGLVAR